MNRDEIIQLCEAEVLETAAAALRDAKERPIQVSGI